jgi:hypothetical protein
MATTSSSMDSGIGRDDGFVGIDEEEEVSRQLKVKFVKEIW